MNRRVNCTHSYEYHPCVMHLHDTQENEREDDADIECIHGYV